MTHDELLELIGNYQDYAPVDYGQVDLVNALRAVVELHKVQPTTIPGDPKCDACSGLDWEDYPCPTIQAIEKELQ